MRRAVTVLVYLDPPQEPDGLKRREGTCKQGVAGSLEELRIFHMFFLDLIFDLIFVPSLSMESCSMMFYTIGLFCVFLTDPLGGCAALPGRWRNHLPQAPKVSGWGARCGTMGFVVVPTTGNSKSCGSDSSFRD